MVFFALVLLLCASQTCAMDLGESFIYDCHTITVVNQCPYAINVTFDASRLKSGADCSTVGFTPEDACRMFIIQKETAISAHFMRLAQHKNGVESILSTLQATITAQNDCNNCQQLTLDPHKTQTINVSSGIIAKAVEL